MLQGVIRVLYIEDNPIDARLVLAQIEFPYVCESVDCWCSALSMLSDDGAAKFDIVLLDLNLPGEVSGLVACEKIKNLFPHLKVLVFSGDRSPETIDAAKDAGADGYEIKGCTRSQLEAALSSMTAGHAWFNNPIVRDADREIHRKRKARRDLLSPREHEILDLRMDGKGSKQAADELGISESTLKTHQSRLREKLLNADSVIQAGALRDKLA